MKIQLVHPPVLVHPGALTALRPGPPLGLAYIAAALRTAGHEVSVLDALAEAPTQTVPEGRLQRLGLTEEQIVERIDPAARAIGVTDMFSFSWPAVRSVIRAIKARHPDKIVVCGGEHFTSLPEYTMQEAPIDYVVMGEGEEIATGLFRALEAHDFDPSKVDGVAWRRGSEIVRNGRAQRIRALDEIAWPAWDLFNLDVYDANNFVTGIKYGKTVPILATRGCPYQCTYCSSPQMWTTRWYARDPIDVADEITSYVEKYDANNFPFQDLTAIVKKKWIVDFSRELIARDLDVRWQLPSGTRCEVVDEEVAPLLWESGCRSLCYAPESGSERTRKLIKKRLKSESLTKAVKATVRNDINITAFLVIGFPHDTAADLRETVKMVRQLARMGVEDVACPFFYPIPATELYEYLRGTGRVSLGDDFLMTPLYGHDKWLTEDRNYCEHLPAWRLTVIKYWIVANFYLTSFVSHPGRVFRLIRNLVKNREDSKMDTFLIETKRKLLRSFRKRAKPALPAS
ncbi:MAG: radical SAM protein [Myxococcota bacterium]